MKRGLYYREGAHGYTAIRREAWTVAEEEARAHEYKRGTPDEWVTIERDETDDYTGDLNAMHEAEELLDYDQCLSFEDELCDVTKKENDAAEIPPPWRFSVAHATAAQRAEALLRTIGKWEEEN